MHGMERAEAARQALHMLGEFGLEDVVDEFAVNYSMGMKKKLGLACALIHDPDVLILDEPINGLDPRAARDVQERLKLAAASGKTIFMSTHLLDMAERVCTRVGIIHHGGLVATGTLAELRQRVEHSASLEQVFLSVTEESAAQASDP
jgi:ABC-2 type transport system ATP-binding protein